MPGEGQSSAAAEAAALPLERIDVSDPRLYERDVAGHYFARLRREAPVHYCADGRYGPFWSITRYADIVRVNAADDLFSCDYRQGGHVLGYERLFREHGVDARMFQSTDAPVHTAQRKAIAPIVARASVREMEDAIRARAVAILDGLPVGETFDWVERVAVELTTQVLATLFDFPWEERRLLTRWSDVAVTEPGFGIVATWAERREALEACFARFAELWQERLGVPAGADLLSLMVHSPATRDLSPAEFLGNLINLIVGGNDTTRNSLTGGVVALNRYPAQYARLRAEPALVERMVPEIIRWQTPISHMARTARADYEVGGKTIRAGDRVALWYLSGNRDEEAFEQAEAFDIERPNPRRHCAFGFGAHHCVGYRLAELQLRVTWEEILRRFHTVEVVGAPRRVCSNIIHGYASLPVRVIPW
ncbi:MAG: cytochrome P450 [Gammaproteobacteria bacterium]|nr:cytochrome P450 [Gammaproteobacteria bacterium]MCP5202332.1 cytochrome P450 [Gammaproteobacteria bacterium]